MLLQATADVPTGGLFDEDRPIHLRIRLGPNEWNQLAQAPRKYVSATLSANESPGMEVGVHLKGSIGSFRSLDDKPGWTLDFGRYNADQRFRGYRKIHLNNSIEDASTVNEQMGAELFRAAGVPAPRVTRAEVMLNGRLLGLYVLVEGITTEWLGEQFGCGNGTVHDHGSGGDVDQPTRKTGGRKSGMEDGIASDLSRLSAAAMEPDLGVRWEAMQGLLDVDRFLSFMAIEVLVTHHDGYCLARNNFQIYHDPTRDLLVFLPHGMDQLFWQPQLPRTPHMAGLVAKALLEIPEARQKYEARHAELSLALMGKADVIARLDRLRNTVRAQVGAQRFRELDLALSDLRARIERRCEELLRQRNSPPAPPAAFRNGLLGLTGWVPNARADDGPTLSRPPSGDESQSGSLKIDAGPRSPTLTSWRTRVLLPQGRYRFEGKIRTAAVGTLPFGSNQGAILRVVGRSDRSEALCGTLPWKVVGVAVKVDASEELIELVCELRGQGGIAWFDEDSLRLIPHP